MDWSLLLKAVVMGIVEGLTEFLPVSSTGHLIVVGRALAIPSEVEVAFEIFIQLGAILAVVVYFARDLLALLRRAAREVQARVLLLGVLVAFLPAALVGVVFDDWIEAHLFSPWTVALALIVGGAAMLWIETRQRQPRVHHVEMVTLRDALGVGLAQVLSLVPGVSRAAATILGGMLVGMDRPTALRFSFYLSIPTLGAASVYSLVRALDRIPAEWGMAFGVGFGVSFLVALLVVKAFLAYVARYSLKPFGWYRIVAGVVVIALAAVGWLR